MIIKNISRRSNGGLLIKYIFREKRLTTRTYMKVIANLKPPHGSYKDVYVAGIKLTKENVRQLLSEREDAKLLADLKKFDGTMKEFIEERLMGASYRLPVELRHLAAEARNYSTAADFSKDILYHGTDKPVKEFFSDSQRILWTTQSPALAQAYIPVSGNEWVVRKPYAEEANIRWKFPANRFEKELLHRMGYEITDIEKNEKGKVTAWKSDKPLPTRKEVADYVEHRLLYTADTEGRYRVKGEGYDDIQPAWYKAPGTLYVIPGLNGLKIFDATHTYLGAQNLSRDAHAYIQEKQALGYDGIKVWDAVDTETGKYSHVSVGLFPQAFEKLNPIPIVAHHVELKDTLEPYSPDFDPEVFHRRALRSQEPLIIRHNLTGHTLEENIQEFEKNESNRVHKSSRQVAIHHTILSWGDKDAQKITDSMLHSLANEYIRLRGENNLYLGTVHRDDTEHVHLHIAMSATRLDGISSRIPKEVFQEIKIKLQQFQKDRFPELSNSVVRHSSTKSKDKGRLGGKIVKNDERASIRTSLRGCIDVALKTSTSLDHFIGQLKAQGYAAYHRNGRLTGVQAPSGLKFRFSRLDIDPERLLQLDGNKTLRVHARPENNTVMNNQKINDMDSKQNIQPNDHEEKNMATVTEFLSSVLNRVSSREEFMEELMLQGYEPYIQHGKLQGMIEGDHKYRFNVLGFSDKVDELESVLSQDTKELKALQELRGGHKNREGRHEKQDTAKQEAEHVTDGNTELSTRWLDANNENNLHLDKLCDDCKKDAEDPTYQNPKYYDGGMLDYNKYTDHMLEEYMNVTDESHPSRHFDETKEAEPTEAAVSVDDIRQDETEDEREEERIETDIRELEELRNEDDRDNEFDRDDDYYTGR